MKISKKIRLALSFVLLGGALVLLILVSTGIFKFHIPDYLLEGKDVGTVSLVSKSEVGPIHMEIGPGVTVNSHHFKKGDEVILSKDATVYSTGERIPDEYKGGAFTVLQQNDDSVLLKELNSWVYTYNVDPS